MDLTAAEEILATVKTLQTTVESLQKTIEIQNQALAEKDGLIQAYKDEYAHLQRQLQEKMDTSTSNTAPSTGDPATSKCDNAANLHASSVTITVNSPADEPIDDNQDEYTTQGRRNNKRQHPDSDESHNKFPRPEHSAQQTNAKPPSTTHRAGFAKKPPPAVVTQTAAPPQPKAQRIPPIVLRNKDRYNQITAHLKTIGVDFGQATNTNEGIKLHLATIEDYRKTQAFLESNNEQFHTYSLPEDKKLRVILRGVPENWDMDFVKAKLKEQNFNPSTTIRYFNAAGQPAPLVLTILPAEEKSIFQLTSLNHIRIRPETQKSKARSTQCHRCQLYGHSQSRCRASPKCVKCAGDHFSDACPKPRETTATCANCGGPHPASYQGCQKHPKHTKPAEPRALKPAPPGTFQWGTQNNRPGPTQSQHASPSTNQETLHQILQMQQQLNALISSIVPRLNG